MDGNRRIAVIKVLIEYPGPETERYRERKGSFIHGFPGSLRPVVKPGKKGK
jgi:hypothetical protein